MFKLRKKRGLGYLKNIRNGSDEEKARLTWFLVIFVMIGVFFLWAAGTRENFARLAGHPFVDSSALPAFPKTDKINLGGVLEKSGQQMAKYMAENEAQWQSVGDEYAKENKILDEDGFSSLKFIESKEENGAILLEYAQYYKGVRVLGKGITLAVLPEEDNVTEKNNNLVTGINLAVDPQVSLKAAGIVAEKENTDEDFVFKEGDLAIVNYEAEYYLVWRVVLASDAEAGMKEVLVGALRGNVVPAQAGLAETGGANQTSDIVE